MVSRQAAADPGLEPETGECWCWCWDGWWRPFIGIRCCVARRPLQCGMGWVRQARSHLPDTTAQPSLSSSVLYCRAELGTSCRQFTVLNLLQTMGNYTAACVHTASSRTVATAATVHSTRCSAGTARQFPPGCRAKWESLTLAAAAANRDVCAVWRAGAGPGRGRGRTGGRSGRCGSGLGSQTGAVLHSA